MLTLALAGTLGLAEAGRADLWYEHYARAETALQAGQWAAAIEQLNQALERKGDSGARVRSYGMNVVAYFPYLKLGIAYHHLDQWDAALQAFDTEERLGAIGRAEEDLAELGRYRRLAEDAKAAAADAEAARIDAIVAESLKEVRRLEQRGALDTAMEVLGRALAVAPESAEAQAALDRIRTSMARQQRDREIAERVEELKRQGRDLLAQQRFEEAARAVRQGLALLPAGAPEVATLQGLLDRAQDGLLLALERQQEAARKTLLAEGLGEARGLADAGRLTEALDRLEALLLLEPGNRDAVAMQRDLLATLDQREEERVRRETVKTLLGDGEALFADGRYEPALAAANRLLALEPGHQGALDLARRAYQQIGRRLLGAGAGRENLPPAIRFADFRDELADGTRVERRADEDFRLSGMVLDDSPVEIEIFGPEGEPVDAATSSQAVGDIFVTEFSLHSRLAPGPATFRLTATDREGLRSSSEYQVRFEPPVYRTTAFYAGLAAAALAVVGVLAGLRSRLRRDLRRRRFNPYVAGAPVLDESLFFGRADLVDRILQTVHNNSLLLYGERRIGKTSLLHHLKRRLERLDDPAFLFHPVYADLQGTPEDRFFATLAEDVFHDLEPVLDGLEPSAALARAFDGGAYDYRDFVADLRRVLASLRSRSSKQVKLVLLIDEVDELNDYDPRINQKLRSLFMRSFAESLVAVVAGVEIKKQWEKEGSPWYNFFEEIEVTALRRDEAEALITRPIRGVFDLEDGLVDRLLERTGGKPYPIQRACIALVQRAYEDGRTRLTLADLEALGRPLLDGEGA